jgi:tRNA-Thr(GGU) m(6)t(6)A37 methyltransferase TsaA
MTSCPLPVIGVIRSARTDRASTPVQAALNRSERAILEIAPEYADGLAGLTGTEKFAGFDYLWLQTWLHDSAVAEDDPPALTQVPFLLRSQGRSMGIFATRGPRRVNPIGLSLVQLLEVDGRLIHFAGVDMIDGTPVLDLKPYVSHFDRPPGDPRSGWFDAVDLVEGVTPADL